MRSSVADLDLFTHRVTAWILESVAHAPPNFGALLRALPGVDPGFVASSLRRIAAGSESSERIRVQAATLLFDAYLPSAENLPTVGPIPHPLDCYWPNDRPTLQAMARRLGRLTRPGGSLIYLAWPNCFSEARQQLPNRKHVLFELDPQRADAHRPACSRDDVLTIDALRDELPAYQAEAIVADPPWYPDELMSFLWAAARLGKPGAYVLIALPPIGTRPGIEQERRQVLDWAAQCGLHPRDFLPGALGYLVPPFERAALTAQGLMGTPDNWRRGDLLVFQRDAVTLPVRPQIDREIWHRAHIEEIPFRVRIDEQAVSPGSVSADTLIESIIDGDVLPTVSRREALRRRTMLWTSRNRVFGSSNGPLLAAVLDAMAAGRSVHEAATTHLGRQLGAQERDALTKVSRSLRRLADRESREHGVASLAFAGRPYAVP